MRENFEFIIFSCVLIKKISTRSRRKKICFFSSYQKHSNMSRIPFSIERMWRTYLLLLLVFYNSFILNEMNKSARLNGRHIPKNRILNASNVTIKS